VSPRFVFWDTPTPEKGRFRLGAAIIFPGFFVHFRLFWVRCLWVSLPDPPGGGYGRMAQGPKPSATSLQLSQGSERVSLYSIYIYIIEERQKERVSWSTIPTWRKKGRDTQGHPTRDRGLRPIPSPSVPVRARPKTPLAPAMGG
jgi:hypothetical protein